jgi:hypothetical protein
MVGPIAPDTLNPKYPAYGRHLLYDQHLAGKPVLDTTQAALCALLDVLP